MPGPIRWGWRRRGLLLLAALALGFAQLPDGGMRCRRPLLHSTSPEGDATLTICRHAVFPGEAPQAADGPGWSVLRDADGLIEGLVALDHVAGIGAPPVWTAAAVTLPALAAHPRRVDGSAPWRWAMDRIWRIQGWLGQVPRSADFR